MSRNVTTQCETCIHKDVCKLRSDLANARITVNEALDKLTIDFIYPIEVKCKHHYQTTETARMPDSYTASTAIPYTYTEARG